MFGGRKSHPPGPFIFPLALLDRQLICHSIPCNSTDNARAAVQTNTYTAPEQLSEKEIRDGEARATVEVQVFTVACLALWFCTSRRSLLCTYLYPTHPCFALGLLRKPYLLCLSPEMDSRTVRIATMDIEKQLY
jgi:hypothetical protein